MSGEKTGPNKQACYVTLILRFREPSDRFIDFVRQAHALLSSHYTDYEIIIISDLAEMNSAPLTSLLKDLVCVRILRLSRRAKPDVALTAGLESAIGDFVVVLEPRTSPVELVLEFVDKVRSGTHVVVGVPTGKRVRDGALYSLFQRVFQSLSTSLLGTDLPGLNADTFCFSRNAVNAMTRIRQKRRALSVLIPEMGFPWTLSHYEPTNFGGESVHRPLLPSIRTGLSILIEGSTLPLRLVGVFGLLGSLLSIAYAVYVVTINLIRKDVVQGWTTLSLQISGLMFLVFVMLAFLAEYMVRILHEATDRPLYHIAEERTSSVMVLNRANVVNRSLDVPLHPEMKLESTDSPTKPS